MKLEPKHLAPYLIHKLKLVRENKKIEDDIIIMRGLSNYNVFSQSDGSALISINRLKPILRPLSDLKVSKDLFGEYNWEYPKEFISQIELGQIEYVYMLELFKNHYDVFGLIPQGLAIDINTL